MCIAKASAKVLMQPETLQKIKDNDFKKGDVLVFRPSHLPKP
jgi:cyclic pyranopterin phosphate synthase